MIVQTSQIYRTNNLHTINPTGHPEHARRGTNSPSPIRYRIKCVRPGSRLGYHKRNLPSPKTPTTERNGLRRPDRTQCRKSLYTSFTTPDQGTHHFDFLRVGHLGTRNLDHNPGRMVPSTTPSYVQGRGHPSGKT